MKTRSIFLIVLFIVVVVLIGYKFGVNRQKGDSMNGLKLMLSLAKTKYRSNEKIRVLITLKNSGNENLVVNKRMTVNFSAAPKTLRDITFNITGPSKEIVPFTARVNVRSPSAKDFISLSPGEIIEVFYDIERAYDLKRLGPYSIFAVYQNTIDPYQGKLAWKGEITSNAVTFEIVP